VSEETRDDPSGLTGTGRLQRLFTSWTTVILLDVVVLGLFVEYSESITIDSFTIVIFTCLVVRALVEVTLVVEHRVRSSFWGCDRLAYRAVGLVAIWAILFGSKFVILEVIDLIFRDHVEFDGFIPLVLLIITMILVERAAQAIYDRPAYVQTGDS